MHVLCIASLFNACSNLEYVLSFVSGQYIKDSFVTMCPLFSAIRSIKTDMTDVFKGCTTGMHKKCEKMHSASNRPVPVK